MLPPQSSERGLVVSGKARALIARGWLAYLVVPRATTRGDASRPDANWQNETGDGDLRRHRLKSGGGGNRTRRQT